MDTVNSFKSIKAISSLTKWSYQISCLHFATSHEKSISDGLGGVIKSYVIQAVAGQGVVTTNATELYQFCQENWTKVLKESSIVQNWCFLLVDPNEVCVCVYGLTK